MLTNEFTLTQTQTQPTPGMLAFADAEGCAAWLRAVPLTNIPRYYETILSQLKRLGEVEFAPRERARIAETMAADLRVFRVPSTHRRLDDTSFAMA